MAGWRPWGCEGTVELLGTAELPRHVPPSPPLVRTKGLLTHPPLSAWGREA